jgi:hypothetical protein
MAGQASASFFEKKAAKKRLIPPAHSRPTSTASRTKIFCALFFKTAPLSRFYPLNTAA